MFKWLKKRLERKIALRRIERNKQIILALLLSRLAWLETQEMQMEFRGPLVTVRIFSQDWSSRMAEGVGDNMITAIDDVLEKLRYQEKTNGKS